MRKNYRILAASAPAIPLAAKRVARPAVWPVGAEYRSQLCPQRVQAVLICGLVSLLAACGANASATGSQPLINSFSPSSGGSGVLVTLVGSGFTGSTQAWVGNAHDAALHVVSDTRATVTVPADATSGAVAILNSAHAAFTASSFTVIGGAAYPQQSISGFSPAAGPKGTVVTVIGSGFNGSDAAWIGSAHDAGIKVVSDTQAQITIPNDAATGQLALLNPQHAVFSPASFTVTTTPVSSSSSGSSSSGGGSSSSSSGSKTGSSSGGSSSSSSSSGTTGAMSIRVQGNQFVDRSGQAVQLRGVNFSGFESVAIQGWDPSDPSGAQGGQANGPSWAAIQSWKANVVRLPLNEASWLDYSCTDTSGVVHNPDPGDNYKSSVETQVSEANAAGLYVILDLHWAAPGTMCPMLQTQMADADHSLAFWTAVATQFKGNPAVMFELFNEPFFDFDFTGNSWSYMMQGTGGSFTGFPATSGSSNWQNVTQTWAVASYQQMINAVRATGATNVVLVGAMQYTEDLSSWLSYRPTDPQSQMAATWHAYPTYGTTWGTAAYAQPNYSPQIFTEVQNILAAGIPVIATETGDQDSSGTEGSPLVSTVTAFADQNGVSVIGWAWDVWGDANDVLITGVTGTPTDGYGQFFQSWMVNHAQ